MRPPFFSLETMWSLVCGLRASMYITRSFRLCVRLLDLGLVSIVGWSFDCAYCGLACGIPDTLLPPTAEDLEKLGGGGLGLLGLRRAAGTGLTLSTGWSALTFVERPNDAVLMKNLTISPITLRNFDLLSSLFFTKFLSYLHLLLSPYIHLICSLDGQSMLHHTPAAQLNSRDNFWQKTPKNYLPNVLVMEGM